MRHSTNGQRAALKAKLLIGVAGAAAAAGTAAMADQAASAPPADAPKWVPYSDVGGSVGSGLTAGRIDFFVPVSQDLDSLVFLNLGVGNASQSDLSFTASLGYRAKIDSDWVIGVHAGYDNSENRNRNSFDQGTLGAELMSADWDVRLNGYLADTRRKAIPGRYELYIHNTSIAVLQGEDVAYSGFDGEVGYRVFSTDTSDFRVFIGGYSFSHGKADTTSLGQNFDFSYRDIAGVKARAEATLYDLDELGPQSRLTVDGEVDHDDVRGTTGYVGATLRIPLGNFAAGAGAQALDELDRRMADPVRKNSDVLTHWQFTKPEPVVIYGAHMTSQPTNTLYYVDNTLGAGSYANPTTLHDATTRASTNAFIVLTSKQGNVNTSLSGDGVMQAGQTIVGGGETFSVRGTMSGTTFSHDFAPGTVNPTIATTSYDTVIKLASLTNLYGFSIKGDFDNAIYGKNVTNVNIRNLAIDGTGGGYTGIDIYRNVSGNETLNISNVAVSNVGGYGVYLDSFIHDGGTSTQNIALDHVSVTNAHYDGLHLYTFAGAHTTINQNLTISNSTIHDTYYTGINVITDAVGAGATINQTVAISNASVTNAGEDGIVLNTYASGGATIGQTASVTNTTISGVGYNTGYAYGLDVFSRATGAGTTITQNVTVTNTNVSNVFGYINGTAMYFGANARDGAAIVQGVTIDPSSGTQSGTGIDIYASAYDNGYGSTTVSQIVNISGDNFSNNAYYGVKIGANVGTDVGGSHTSQAAVYQGVTIANTTMNHNGTGLDISESAYDGASVTQTVKLSGVQITHNKYDGVDIYSNAGALGFAAQNIGFSGSYGNYNQVSYNGGDGIYIGTDAHSGGLIQQNISIYYTNIAANKGSGVHVSNYAGQYLNPSPGLYYYSHLQQNLSVQYGSASFNVRNGIQINNTAYYGAQIDQLVYVYRESLDFNHLDGFAESSTVTSYRPGSGFGITIPTNIHSNVYIINADTSYNLHNGINFQSYLHSPTYPALLAGYSYLEQHILVANTTATYNGQAGFVNNAYDKGVFGLNAQYVTLSNSHFDNNTGNGATFDSRQFFGPLAFGATIQNVTISGSTFGYNGANGLYLSAYAHGNQGRAEQHFTVQNSSFDGNSADGIYLHRVAENGVYVAGHPCTAAQGLAGGCAFVRQTFNMIGGAVSYNGSDGIRVQTYVNNYGAVYGRSGRPHAPTLELYGTQVNSNDGRGLNVSNHTSNHSYLYQYIAAVDTTFNHNSSDGMYGASYVAGHSTMLQRALLYSFHTTAAATYNTGNGFKFSEEVLGTSYGRDVNIVAGANLSHNGSFGFDGAISYADGSSIGLQVNSVYFNAVNHNGDGVGLYSIGPGAHQASYLVSNTVTHNSFVGVYGEANFGAFQYVKVYTGGNTVNSNGTNYLFNHFGGSTQILN